MTEHSLSVQLADAFHAAFVTAYTALARQKYPRHAARLPFHGQDVHVICGGNRWWHILCVSEQGYGETRIGPYGRYTVQVVDPVTHPDLADLPDQNSPRKEEFRLLLGAGFFIYHEAYAPPGPTSEDEMSAAGTALAERLVAEHVAPLLEFDALKTRLSNMRNAAQLLHDVDEALACLLSEHYRAAIVVICAAAESALVGRLEEMGHPIRQEEHSRTLGHEHHSFSGIVAESYRRGAITIKTRDRLEMLNGLRRGTEHCRPDATIQDDALYCWTTVQQLLGDLAR